MFPNEFIFALATESTTLTTTTTSTSTASTTGNSRNSSNFVSQCLANISFYKIKLCKDLFY